MTKSQAFLYFCLSFISGIFISSFFLIPPHLFIGAGLTLGILLVLIPAFSKNKELFAIIFCSIFLVLGILRYQSVRFKIENSPIQNFIGQETILVGLVNKEPDIRKSNIKLTLKIEKIGNILITTNRYPEYQYGDVLEISGKVEAPLIFEDFNYKDYLAKTGISAVIYWPKIRLIEKNKGNFAYTKILGFKNKLRESIYRSLSPPQSSILGAMVLGDKRKVSDDLKEKLNISGLRHITAVSGLHITVLTTILMSLLIGLGFWKKQAFYFSSIFIAFFIIMIGFQPSAVRAGIMGGLFLLAHYMGKGSQSFRLIVFAAALMLAQNPLLLKSDIGFQLSFLAIMGIIYLSPSFHNWLRFIPFENSRNILAMTFSAYLFTLPILIYNFGYISLVAPFTNLLVVPFLYWIMLFGLVFGITGIIWPFLGWILSWPSWLLLTYLIKIVDWFSNLSWASLTLEISLVWLVIFYFLLTYFVLLLKKKQKLKFLNY